jgi:putative transposase
MSILSYKYRLDPNKAQSAAIADMLADFCRLYNACLEQRIDTWERRQISVGYNMQAAELKAVRCAIPELARWSFSAEQQVLRRLDKTFKAFFARGRGFPRFRATARYHAADFRVGDGLTIRKGGRIGIVGVPGEIKIRWHRELPGKSASAILTRQAGKWYIVFHVEVEAVDRAGPDSVGIDLGLKPGCIEQWRNRPAPELDKAGGPCPETSPTCDRQVQAWKSQQSEADCRSCSLSRARCQQAP